MPYIKMWKKYMRFTYITQDKSIFSEIHIQDNIITTYYHDVYRNKDIANILMPAGPKFTYIKHDDDKHAVLHERDRETQIHHHHHCFNFSPYLKQRHIEDILECFNDIAKRSNLTVPFITAKDLKELLGQYVDYEKKLLAANEQVNSSTRKAIFIKIINDLGSRNDDALIKLEAHHYEQAKEQYITLLHSITAIKPKTQEEERRLQSCLYHLLQNLGASYYHLGQSYQAAQCLDEAVNLAANNHGVNSEQYKKAQESFETVMRSMRTTGLQNNNVALRN
jgi:tetratricopeptide (TPR) repeat protein